MGKAGGRGEEKKIEGLDGRWKRGEMGKGQTRVEGAADEGRGRGR